MKRLCHSFLPHSTKILRNQSSFIHNLSHKCEAGDLGVYGFVNTLYKNGQPAHDILVRLCGSQAFRSVVGQHVCQRVSNNLSQSGTCAGICLTKEPANVAKMSRTALLPSVGHRPGARCTISWTILPGPDYDTIVTLYLGRNPRLHH